MSKEIDFVEKKLVEVEGTLARIKGSSYTKFPRFLEREMSYLRKKLEEIKSGYNEEQRMIQKYSNDIKELNESINDVGKFLEENYFSYTRLTTFEVRVGIFPHIYEYLKSNPDEILDTSSIHKILEQRGIEMSKDTIGRKLKNPDREWQDKLDIKKEKAIGSIFKYLVSLKVAEEYKSLGKFKVKSSFLEFLEEFLPKGHIVEGYELFSITKYPLSVEDVEILEEELRIYLKERGLNVLAEEWLYVK